MKSGEIRDGIDPGHIEEALSSARQAMAFLKQGFTAGVVDEAISQSSGPELSLPKLSLFRLDEITYEEKAPRREAMENVIGTFRHMKGVHFVYLILGTPAGVRFYLGVARDLNCPAPTFQSITDVGNEVLQPALRGNFRGCQLKLISDNDEKQEILDVLSKSPYGGILEGVPTIDEKSENFQGVERLVDVMLGQERFALVVLARPYDAGEIDAVAHQLEAAADKLTPLARCQRRYDRSDTDNESEQVSKTWNKGVSRGTTDQSTVNHSRSSSESADSRKDEMSNIQVGTMESGSETTQKTQHTNRSSNTHKGGSSDTTTDNGSGSGTQNMDSQGMSRQKNEMYASSMTESSGHHKTTNKTESDGTAAQRNVSLSYGRNTMQGTMRGKVRNASLTYQLELEQKAAVDWLKYIDEVLMPRVDDGRGKGLFLSCAYLCSDKRTTLYRLANTIGSLYSGPKGNRMPLTFHEFGEEDAFCWNRLQNLQIPYQVTGRPGKAYLCSAFSKACVDDKLYYGNWLSADQLSILAGVPQKEVIGLKLRKEVEFGLNAVQHKADDNLPLGKLVQCGSVQERIPVMLSRKSLSMHTFITGVTGSGKTTTCQNILLQSGLPFLVVEPAKTEYRLLQVIHPELDITFFTPGAQDVAPFFLNPFELFPGESITSRADMIKATFEATFDMQAAIPQLLEAAIYRIYRDKGWNIGTNRWKGKGPDDEDGPFADGVYAFPTLQDFYDIMPTIIREQGFDERLYTEYLGTVHAYIQGLLVGSKGMMFNTPRSVDFRDLIKGNVVIELEEIKNASEKSLIMGLIMTNLLQAVKAAHFEASRKQEAFQHITLIEEAHRLLSRYQPGDSQNKKQGVMVFTDMLAEVRKYGESLIIADQIPDQMTPEVLKNTNTKIVHKIFAQDDKDTIGNTMALDQEQKAFLSNLVTGRAVVFSQDWTKAVQVQVDKLADTTGYQEIEPKAIHDLAVSYYQRHYRKGILPGLEILPEVSERDVEHYLELMKNDALIDLLQENARSAWRKVDELNAEILGEGRICGKKILVAYLSRLLPEDKQSKEWRLVLAHWIQDVLDGKEPGQNEALDRLDVIGWF